LASHKRGYVGLKVAAANVVGALVVSCQIIRKVT
jgi:hypothetical protein